MYSCLFCKSMAASTPMMYDCCTVNHAWPLGWVGKVKMKMAKRPLCMLIQARWQQLASLHSRTLR